MIWARKLALWALFSRIQYAMVFNSKSLGHWRVKRVMTFSSPPQIWPIPVRLSKK